MIFCITIFLIVYTKRSTKTIRGIIMQNKSFGDYICQFLALAAFCVSIGLQGCQRSGQPMHRSFFAQIAGDVCEIIVGKCDYGSQLCLFLTSTDGLPWLEIWHQEQAERKEMFNLYCKNEKILPFNSKLNFQATCLLVIRDSGDYIILSVHLNGEKFAEKEESRYNRIEYSRAFALEKSRREMREKLCKKIGCLPNCPHNPSKEL
jgi:hypothetical protein